MPATSANVIRCSPPSTRRARERENAPSAPRPPAPPPERRARNTNSPTSRITGPKPRIRLVSRLPELIGLACTITLCSCRSLESSTGSAKVGISVSKFLAALPFGSSGGLTAFLNSPSTVSPRAEMRSTLPASTWARNVGLYGTSIERSLPGPSRATLT